MDFVNRMGVEEWWWFPTANGRCQPTATNNASLPSHQQNGQPRLYERFLLSLANAHYLDCA